jgi:hypothetical protein
MACRTFTSAKAGTVRRFGTMAAEPKIVCMVGRYPGDVLDRGRLRGGDLERDVDSPGADLQHAGVVVLHDAHDDAVDVGRSLSQ